uniref:Uncharacterized protein n=1 Tax=uncultured marine virus TaxID=186617 RepID=A0A0F7L7F1_9VIRU|nr:hypothetical protein [uncultured marine virus]
MSYPPINVLRITGRRTKLPIKGVNFKGLERRKGARRNCGEAAGVTLPLITGNENINRRSGWEFVAAIPEEYGEIVGSCILKDQVYYACKFAIFKLVDDKIVPLALVNGKSAPKVDIDTDNQQ